MSEEEEKIHIPKWDVVEDLFNTVSDHIDKMFTEKKANFIEIDIAMMMIGEKIRQEKHFVYSEMEKQQDAEESEPKDTKNTHFYG